MPPQISTPNRTPSPPPPEMQAPPVQPRWVIALKQIVFELRQQRGIAAPLTIMNLTWFAKLTITTIFLARLGDLQLAGGALGFTFANVTGFSVLSGLCGAMEPICGQAHGARNRGLLRKTLLMSITLLLSASIPISFLWLNMDTILLRFGQQKEIASIGKKYALFLLPDLAVTSFLSPLKAYLNSQGATLPALFTSATALVLHLPLNIFLSKLKGLEGVAMAVWLTDLFVAIMLALYVFIIEIKDKSRQDIPAWWWKQSMVEWARLLRLAVPCCLNTCLEWWCYEILVLLTGNLPDSKRMVSVITIVLNFDYLLFSVMLSLATAASVRVSNELGAGRTRAARTSAHVSMGMGALGGLVSAAAMAGARGWWGVLFSKDREIVTRVKKTMLIMAVVEVVNFPLAVSGGIVRGTARPLLGMYASVGGFYLVALPLAVLLGFKTGLGLSGMLLGFLVGGATGGVLLLGFLACIDWEREVEKAQRLTAVSLNRGDELNGCEGGSDTGDMIV
ncbi:protein DETOXIFICATION 56 [Phalaenopsis equestris]|uniref:protein DETOXIFICATION 56 n=1 Tax=Phalaenopsis equestris TaxID=78828 RepID=UPI0009E28B67|nr:protein DETOXIFICATION 56 [Phalaenopsis equestris]